MKILSIRKLILIYLNDLKKLHLKIGFLILMHTFSTVYRCESALHGGIYNASFDRILHFKNYLDDSNHPLMMSSLQALMQLENELNLYF